MCGFRVPSVVNPPPARRAESPIHTIAGNAYVTGGDGVQVAGQEVRLVGLNAPEWDPQAEHQDGSWFDHGRHVKSVLIKEIGGKHVRVSVEGTDRFGRLLGTVTCEGRDIGEWLVREGHALAAYDDRYKPVQREARKAKRGMWAHPHAWVHRHWQPVDSQGRQGAGTAASNLDRDGPAVIPRAPASGERSCKERWAVGGHADELAIIARGQEAHDPPESSGRAGRQASPAGPSGTSVRVGVCATGIEVGGSPAVEGETPADPDNTRDRVDGHVPVPRPWLRARAR